MMFRLVQAKANDTLIFTSVEGGRGACQRLIDIGLVPGEKLTVLHNSGWGPVTVLIKGARVALGQGLAARIIVKEV